MRLTLILLFALAAFASPAMANQSRHATIPLDDVAAVWVKGHDGAWTHWITGAPDFVNRPFAQQYAAHLLATPEPTAEPEPQYGGFTISGKGPAVVPVEGVPLDIHIRCAVSMRNDGTSPWSADAFITLVGAARALWGTHNVEGSAEVYLVRKYLPSGELLEHEYPHRIFLNNRRPGIEGRFMTSPYVFAPPYSLKVETGEDVTWSTRCWVDE